MKKTIEFRTKRNISFLPIENHLGAYREEFFVNEKLISTKEGIMSKKEFSQIQHIEQIPPSCYHLFKKEFKEKIRTNLLETLFDELEQYVIKNPYSYIQKNGYHNVDLLYISFNEHQVYDANYNKLPRAYHFEYILSHTHNQKYDLDKSFEILKQRDDIRFINGGINEIPYYHAEEGKTHYLDFIWIPKKEDFEKIANSENIAVLRERVLNEILGLVKHEKKDR